MKKIAVIIPCYNESQTIRRVVKDFQRSLPTAVIYVYDNNSTDGSGKIACQTGAIVRLERQQGKGNVIRRAFREVEADCYVLVDGDATYPATVASEMVELVLQKDVDMVIGDRLSSTYFQQNKRPFHNLGNTLVRRTINFIFRCQIRDIMTGYRAFSRNFVKTFPVLSEGFEIETEMTIHAVHNNLSLKHIVIDYRDRQQGSHSKLNTYGDGFKVLQTIFRLFRQYKPLTFFGSLAIFLLLFALTFFIPLLFEFWQTGLVERFPTLIVCGFVVIAAIQSFFTGLILSSLVQKNRQDFEWRLIEMARQKD